jgi:hypothetical protein
MEPAAGHTYEIRFRGHLDKRYARWFDDLVMKQLPDGETKLIGRLPDPSALHGILNRIRDLGLELTLVKQIDFEDQS